MLPITESPITELPGPSKARHAPHLAGVGTAVHMRACCVALVMAGLLWGMAAAAEVPAAGAPAAEAPHAAGTQVPSIPTPSKNAAPVKKPFVSPYARAAAQREHAGQAPVGHAPTMVQLMGKPRKPHVAPPRK